MEKRTSKAFPPTRAFSTLSIRDLLDAREAYHRQFSAMRNVIATAIGRYLIVDGDACIAKPPEPKEESEPASDAPARTFANSAIKPWSWPCVLVLVREWESSAALGDQGIPKFLYLPDGRVVPTCVVELRLDEEPRSAVSLHGNSSGTLAGGYQCFRESQGAEKTGTIACVVKKSGDYYALTNRHVVGPGDDAIYAAIRGRRELIGRADAAKVAELPFEAAFPEWRGIDSLVAIDAGLVHIEDASRWTAQVYGIGEIADTFDATSSTINLDLLGCPVRAFGGFSGSLEGEIKALFFRYKSIGGKDHVSDLLIGPKRDDLEAAAANDRVFAPSPASQPGDSGTLWFYDPPLRGTAGEPPARGDRARRLTPIAMQWGGFRSTLRSGAGTGYSLAAFLSTVCAALDVEVATDWRVGFSEYWGKIAHFAIGWKASELLPGGLGKLMSANRNLIGFDDTTLGAGAAFSVGSGQFTPLADAPDYVLVPDRGRPNEGQQHYADIDFPLPWLGRSLLDESLDKGNFSADFWLAQFSRLKAMGCGPEEGTLPFRVWQIWDEMAASLRKAGDRRSLLRFFVAAGLLAHYVGDASMPFHCSYLHHGRLPMVEIDGSPYPVAHSSDEYAAYSKTAEAKIHSVFDETIMEVDTSGALDAVNAALERSKAAGGIADGKRAAIAVLELMRSVRGACSPERIIDLDDPSLSPKKRADRLWNDETVRAAVVSSLAGSVELLARIWKSVWDLSGAERTADAGSLFTEKEVMELVRDRSFLPAMRLEELKAKGY